jgi:hypothetical protein
MRRRSAVSLFAAASICAVAIALLGLPAASASGTPSRACFVPGTQKTLDQIWHPDMPHAIGYNDTRGGDIAFAVRTDRHLWSYRPDHAEWSASVLKAMLLVAYLDQPSVANRPLDGYDDSLLRPMITVSDNSAADRVISTVGTGALYALAGRVGMTQFAAASPIWGESQITATDQTKFFLHIDSYVAARHRAYAMNLLASITPSQRWGVGEVAPNGWQLYFKGGWGSGTGLIDNQVAVLVRGCARVSIAVLTMNDGSHDYGKETLRGIFSRLLRGFPTPRVVETRGGA